MQLVSDFNVASQLISDSKILTGYTKDAKLIIILALNMLTPSKSQLDIPNQVGVLEKLLRNAIIFPMSPLSMEL